MLLKIELLDSKHNLRASMIQLLGGNWFDLLSKTFSNYFLKFFNIENIPKGVALCLRRICNSDNKFEKHSKDYQNYFIARDYKPTKVRKQFSDIRNISREEARQPKTHNGTLKTDEVIKK